MANIPVEIRVGTRVYKIVFDDERIADACDEMGTLVSAFSDHTRFQIVLPRNEDGRFSPLFQRETIMHEIIHSAFRAAAYDSLKPQIEEEVAQVLDRMILGALRDNPKLVKYLCS